MKPSLHPALLSYLRSLQGSTSVGLHGISRTSVGRSSRTLYRWHRSLGDQLLIVPNVGVEGLGLQHAHVFIEHANEGAVRFPFAVEAAMVTPDFCREVLYLHCLVPSGLVAGFARLVQELGTVRVTWSSSGWQQFAHGDEEFLLPMKEPVRSSELLRRYPFIVPAMAELWAYPNSLPLAWYRIYQRLGENVRRYLPGTTIRHVNGKTHLTDAFGVLRRELLLRQQIIRYHPLLAVSVEVFLLVRMERDDARKFLGCLREVLHAVETYPMEDGYWCRVLGPHRLLDAIINLPPDVRECLGSVYFHTKRHPTPRVGFDYERLFDPKKGRWRLTR